MKATHKPGFEIGKGMVAGKSISGEVTAVKRPRGRSVPAVYETGRLG